MATTLRRENGVTVYRADRPDINGNSRYIVHFMDFLTDEEVKQNDVLSWYELAARKIKRCGGGWRRYTCREFGGGFITQGDYCSGYKTVQEVLKIKNSTL